MSAEDVSGSEAVGGLGADGLETPKNLDGVLKKHAELKAGAEAVAIKRGRGRPPKSGAPGAPPAPRVSNPNIPADIFSADSVRPFVELPFGLACVWTKSDAFRLDTRESDTLSSQGALVANLYAPGWNPKAVALVAFALGFAAIATRKTLGYLGEKSARKKFEAEKVA